MARAVSEARSHADRRTTELLLLIAGAVPVLVIYALYVVNTGVALSFETLAVPIGLIVAFIAAHIAIRVLAPGADPAILPVVFVLSGIGITFVTRLAPDLAVNQVMWLFLAIVCMVLVLAFVRNIDDLARYKYTLGVAGLVLILLPMLFGVEQSGSKLWLNLFGVSFQPGELAKIFVTLFLAAYLADNRELLSVAQHQVGPFTFPRLRMLAPVFVMWGVSLAIVVFERDLGSAVLFFTIFVIMLFVATGRVGYVVVSVVLLALGAFACYHLFSHVKVRFDIWIDPFQDPSNTGLQIVQSLYSLADGGLVGQGIGRGLPTLIPVVESDFIFSAIGEEMGLLGGAAVIFLYMLFCVRGFATAARAKSDMAAFTCVGLTSAIGFQAFLIIAGVTRLMPLTGVTLPFMSQGGSSLLASFIIVALLLRAGDQATGREALLAGAGVGAEARRQGRSVRGSRGARGARSGEAGGVPSATGSALHARLSFGLETPESGVLGRVALSKRLTVLITFFTIIFAVLVGNLTFVQTVMASTYQNMPNNNHTLAKSAQVQRGAIITSDGVTLAESLKGDDGFYYRSYPNGALASNVVGYLSTQYGSTGIENSMNDVLTGHADYSNWLSALYSLAGMEQPGNTVQLTIDSRMQQAAETALEGRKGAIVLLNPSTGAVLACASAPGFSYDQIGDLIASGSTNGELLNRATQALYAPGSTFKVITLAAALQTGVATLNTTYPSPATMEIGGANVSNVDDQDFGDITVRYALAVSANTVFGQLAVQEGPEVLCAFARGFGYGTELGQDFACLASVMPDPNEMTEWETAWAGCGQPVGEHASPAGPQTTVMQNAVVAAAIANGGIAMNPFLVARTLSPEGVEVSATQPRSLGQAVDANTAASLGEAMLDVTTEGTGTSGQVWDALVAGKTGTAEEGDHTNSLFIGYAPYEHPTIAISVLVEGEPGEDVRSYATRIAGQVLAESLYVQSQGAEQ